jgi:hypothetical protein
MVSGYLLGRLQLSEAFLARSALPYWRALGRVLLPYVLYLALYAGAKIALGLPVHWSVLTFTTNFIDLDRAFAAGVQGLNVMLWYVDCLLQLILVLGLATAVNFRWRLTEDPLRFALTLLAVGAVLRFVLSPLIDPDVLRTGITGTSALAHLPTTHLWTVALGMCMAQVRTLGGRLVMAVAVAAFAAGLALTTASEARSWAMLLAFGILLLFVPRLPIPKGLHVVVLVLSGASLFIYLTHVQIARQILQPLGVPDGSVLLWLLTLASGVLLWLGWQRLADWRLRLGGRVLRGLGSLRRRREPI